MSIFPFTYKRLSRDIVVRVSNHFYYSDFGVRFDGNEAGASRRFICTGTPGTGFFERESDSHSYHLFIRSHMAVRKPRYLNLFLNREPSYERELEKTNEAVRNVDDPRKSEILECYASALTIGRMEEELQRLIRAVKDKMGHHHKKHLVSIISHYKRKISLLERDIASVEYQLKDHYSEETWQAYTEVVEAFGRMINRCRRVWHHNDNVSGKFAQVFFDLGVFDFIRSDCYLPLMRDSLGTCYYLLPDALLVARGSLDFDLVPLKTLTMVVQDTSIEETTELLSSYVGDAASMILIPGLNLTFYFNHVKVVVDFVQAVDKLKATL